jgi:DNA replication protein DnaC
MPTNTDRFNKTVKIGEALGDFTQVPATCRICGAKTKAFRAAVDFALCDDCDAREVERVSQEIAARNRAIRTATWNERKMPLRDTDVDQLPAHRAQVDKVLKWKYGPKGLVIHGVTGMGKTRTVLTLLHRLYVEEGHDYEFCRVPKWARELESSPPSQVRSLVSPLFYVPLVVLDDVGKERPTERGISALFDVIDTRTSHGLPLIITSNYNGAKLLERLSERDAETAAAIIRRIREFCVNVAFEPKGGAK